MAKYRIKVIQHVLKGNRVAKYGDIVDGAELVYNIDELVTKGFIEPVADDVDVVDEKDGNDEPKGEAMQAKSEPKSSESKSAKKPKK